ncbi:hypothetical protein Lalb_Chr10g0092531 [Lupinus albus]|uniref:Uncharacterized protein n=1 Tax=Lupinus albus TaxID=3870 RepID=A0A6A4PU42_LUPAL|nr:hypothetical protein Lalb_Chr10g0092531 [Lupinus albus]
MIDHVEVKTNKNKIRSSIIGKNKTYSRQTKKKATETNLEEGAYLSISDTNNSVL